MSVVAVVLVGGACGNNASDGASSSTARTRPTSTPETGSEPGSTAATSQNPATSVSSVTTAKPTSPDQPGELPAMWANADAFFAAFGEAVAGINEGAPEAVPIESPSEFPIEVTAQAPGYGAFAWSVNDGVTIGGLSRLDAEGNAGTGSVVATVLVADQSNEAATTAMAAYLTVYGEPDAAAELGRLLGSPDGDATAEVEVGPLVIRMQRTGDDPVNDPVIVLRVFAAAESDAGDVVTAAVLSLVE